MIPNNAYITIQSFMRTQLNLSGTDLIIYAIIFGFSQDGKSKFRGTLPYLMEWCGCSKNTVRTSLENLVKAGHIIREDTIENNIILPRYFIPNELLGGVSKFDTGVSNFGRGVYQKWIRYILKIY